MINSHGPRTEPWGTEQTTYTILEAAPWCRRRTKHRKIYHSGKTWTRAVWHHVDRTAAPNGEEVGHGRRCQMQQSGRAGTRQKRVHCQLPWGDHCTLSGHLSQCCGADGTLTAGLASTHCYWERPVVASVPPSPITWRGMTSWIQACSSSGRWHPAHSSSATDEQWLV